MVFKKKKNLEMAGRTSLILMGFLWSTLANLNCKWWWICCYFKFSFSFWNLRLCMFIWPNTWERGPCCKPRDWNGSSIKINVKASWEILQKHLNKYLSPNHYNSGCAGTNSQEAIMHIFFYLFHFDSSAMVVIFRPPWKSAHTTFFFPTLENQLLNVYQYFSA